MDSLEDRNHFADIILDSLPKAILVTDRDGVVQLANAAAQELFGSLLVRGRALAPEVASLFPLKRALAGEVSCCERDVLWQGRILAVMASPLQDPERGMIGAVCQARDVTRIRSFEDRARQLEKLAAVAELAAGAAHEIRNPLTAIRGFMQLLQAQGRPDQAAYLDIIVREIDRIDAIIHDLLLLARPIQLSRTPTDMAALVDEVLQLERVHMAQQGIELEQVVEAGPAMLDPKMFRALLLNLVINAVQAMPAGGRLRVELTRENPKALRLQVSDTGQGIPKVNLRRIFDPFFTTKEQGTGLGLALCHSIVQAHGGQIEVESREGEGTTMTVMLDAALPPARK